MTTKVNQFRKPLAAVPPGGSPRIVIEFDLVNQRSVMRTEGPPLSMLQVLDILVTQHASLWLQFVKSAASGIVGPNGQPVIQTGNPPPAPPADNNGGNPA